MGLTEIGLSRNFFVFGLRTAQNEQCLYQAYLVILNILVVICY